MAAALASQTLLMSHASNGPVATVLAGDERMRKIGRFLKMSCLRKPVHSRELSIASWSGVVVSVGERERGPLACLPTASVPTFQGDSTPAMKEGLRVLTSGNKTLISTVVDCTYIQWWAQIVFSYFPYTSLQKKMPDSLQFPVDLKKGAEKDMLGIHKDKAKEAEEMKKWIEEIRAMFRSMTDGEITKSPYDTAWVAMVPALDGSQSPQFPKSLEWIINNQLRDGSWGDCDYFSYFDRIINTLACVVALEAWKTGSSAIKRGVEFIQKNLQELETEKQAQMMLGFEIVFPALMCLAQKLELSLPDDAPVILTICAARQKKLEKIPMDFVHKVPTTILFSLEGLHQEVDWKKLLKLQNEDGSFLNSPASTAACLLHTTDEKALGYLSRVLEKFNDAVPNVYPVDLFERLWIVDRLERLGIGRYFEKEIKACLDYIYKYFTSFGIGWARGSAVQDLDDTAMGFRLLRQHGYDVNENVFRQFRGKENEFFSFAGQSGHSVSGIFNCYRASQTRFPGETLLEAAEIFSRGFLADKLEKNECFDEWKIPKDLRGELEYALGTPCRCSLPLVETAAYLHHYGTDDIWIGKSLYRMPLIHNETFLALAKADFNVCQAMTQLELEKIMRWREDCGFGKLSFSKETTIETVFAAACVFRGPELSLARLTWARMSITVTVMDDYFDYVGSLTDLRKFVAAAREWDSSLMDETPEEAQILFHGMFSTINEMIQEGSCAQGRNIGQCLHEIWNSYLESVLTEAEWTASAIWPSFDEYLKASLPSFGLTPIVLGSLFFSKEDISDEFVKDSKRVQLMHLVNHIGRLLNDVTGWEREKSQGKANAVSILTRENIDWTEEEAISHVRALVDESMLELTREVYQQCHIPESIKLVHFDTARICQLFYQKADGFRHRSFMAKTMKKILFEPML